MIKYALLSLVFIVGCSTSPYAIKTVPVVTPIEYNGLTFWAGGTGTPIMSKTGHSYIITNAHVCMAEEAPKYLVQEGKKVGVETLAFNDSVDLCLLNYIPSAAYPLAKDVRIGMRLLITGYPYLTYKQYSTGTLLGFEEGMLTTEALVYPGNSGGPVENVDGELIGITRAKNLITNISYFIPYSIVDAFINKYELEHNIK